MILAIDVGNTNIVIGTADRDKIYFIERISTNRKKSDLEYMIDIHNILEDHGISKQDIEGSVMSSVVPQINNYLTRAVERILGKKPLLVGPGIKTGIEIATDNPAATGADRVADVVAACAEYPLPLVTIDMGTATTITVVDKDRRLIGGLILPGVKISMNALTTEASQLSGISLEAPKKLLGTNTKDAMKRGIINGTAVMLDGIIDRIEAEMGSPVTVVATGGMSNRIIPYTNHGIIHDDNLLLKGLYILYDMNK